MKYTENDIYLQEIHRLNEFPEDISDVIMYWEKASGTWYHNCMTGVSGFNKNEVLRYKDRNIFIKKGHSTSGFYLTKETLSDGEEVLVLRFCFFDAGTVPKEKRCWEKSFNAWIITKSMETYTDTPYEKGTELWRYVDITGRNMYLPDFKNQLCDYQYSTYTANLLKKFFGFNAFSYRMSCTSFSEKNAITSVVTARNTDIPKKMQTAVDALSGLPLKKLLNKRQEKIVYQISEENSAINRPKFFHVEGTEEYKIAYSYGMYCAAYKFSVIQKVCDGIAVIRYFQTVPNTEILVFNEKRKAKGIEDYVIDEYARTYITGDGIVNCQFYAGKWQYVRKNTANDSYTSILLPWRDKEVEGTKAAYFVSIKKLIEKDMRKYEKLVTENSWAVYSLNNASLQLHIILESPLAESFLNSGYENLIKFAFSQSRHDRPKQFLEAVFGKINEKEKSLTKAIGVPSFMLKEADEIIGKIYRTRKESWYYTDEMHTIRNLKIWYESCPEYLARMNKDMFLKILDAVDECKKKAHGLKDNYGFSDFLTDFNEIMKMFITLYGPGNTLNYINYISVTLFAIHFKKVHLADWSTKQSARRMLNNYKDYIHMIYKMRETITKSDWKFKTEEEINNAHAEMTEIYNLFNNEMEAKKNARAFEKAYARLEKLAYEGDEFCIIPPKTTADIANEGLTLHHCVKSYIDAVLSGKTNILFVRKKDDINTPFYTLEIRSGRIRQCHGFCNCNTSNEEGLDDFLKAYCKEKNVEYFSGNSVLGV